MSIHAIHQKKKHYLIPFLFLSMKIYIAKIVFNEYYMENIFITIAKKDVVIA